MHIWDPSTNLSERLSSSGDLYGLLLKKVCQQPSFKKYIYFNLSFMHFYNISISLRATTGNTFLKKKWKSASLVSVFTTSKKYDRFFKAFSFGTRKKMHFLALFYASRQCIFSWDLKNFWILEHIFLKKAVPILYLLNDIDNW